LGLHLGYQYTSNRNYALKFKFIEAPEPFKWIWKTKVTKKLKMFVWLLFRDRINSRNLLKRKSFQIEGDDYNCVVQLGHQGIYIPSDLSVPF
jgi:hypothetical protein